MTIIIGSDVDGKRLKELIKDYLEDNDYDVLDVTEGKDLDFVDSTVSVAKEVQKSDDNLGIAIDAYGAGSFIVATKIKGMIAAEVSDERSAYMTLWELKLLEIRLLRMSQKNLSMVITMVDVIKFA